MLSNFRLSSIRKIRLGSIFDPDIFRDVHGSYQKMSLIQVIDRFNPFHPTVRNWYVQNWHVTICGKLDNNRTDTDKKKYHFTNYFLYDF